MYVYVVCKKTMFTQLTTPPKGLFRANTNEWMNQHGVLKSPLLKNCVTLKILGKTNMSQGQSFRNIAP